VQKFEEGDRLAIVVTVPPPLAEATIDAPSVAPETNLDRRR